MSQSPLPYDPASGPAIPGFIRFFVRHPNASNLIMILMIIFGLVGLARINTQFFPSVEVPAITTNFVWPGASADDVAKRILKTVEPELRFLNDVKEVSSVAREGSGSITLEFENDADMQIAQSEVEAEVARITTYPEDMEDPVVSRTVFLETVGTVLISGDFPEAALREFAREVRDELISRGISKVNFTGLRDKEIVVDIEQDRLRQLNLDIGDVVGRIQASSEDLPSGTLSGSVERQVRSLAEADTAPDVGEIEVISRANGDKVLVRDIATVQPGYDEDEPIVLSNGNLAIQLDVQRAMTADTLDSMEILTDYIDEIRATIPDTLNIEIKDLRSESLMDRINLLVFNGLTGLVLVLLILFAFLSWRIALWVAIGIPVAMLASIGFMWVSGQSINMLSLFALIMTLGIVVDDAIVVGEHTATRFEMGDDPVDAAERGAARMMWPVIAAILTTQAAFFPILFVQDTLGQIISALPFVVIAVLTASLIECLAILPGHLRHTKQLTKEKPSWFRRNFDNAFAAFREGPVNALATVAVHWRYMTVALSVASLVIALGLVSGGRVAFQFFPSAEAEQVTAQVTLAPGTPREEAIAHLRAIEESLFEIEDELGGDETLVTSVFTVLGKSGRNQGDEFGQVTARLTASEIRTVRTSELMAAWRTGLPQRAGIERVVVTAPRPGPPGRDLDIEFYDGDTTTLKAAAMEAREVLGSFAGVSAIADDLPYGKPELILELTPKGRALGFTNQSVGRQVRNNLEGAIARRFADGDDEVTVRVRLEEEAGGLAALTEMSLFTPTGQEIPLSEVVTISQKRGFSIILREDGRQTVSVTADVDYSVTNNNEIIAALRDGPIPEIAQKYGLDYGFGGRDEEQSKSLSDLKFGSYLGLGIIYVILAWVFANFMRPFAVLAIVPFGIVGAILGHMVMGFDLTILSLFGILGLTGILVNDSIILVSRIDERIRNGETTEEAAIGASKDRLRAVVLTSLTTIGGLIPLLFETSLQAQFLLPMAITIVFGLGVATLFVLFLVPAIIMIGADIMRVVRFVKNGFRSDPPQAIPAE